MGTPVSSEKNHGLRRMAEQLARLVEGSVQAWVEDDGIGIPPGELTRIFKTFYQVEPHMTRRYSGLGIGLTISRELVEAHGGSIWADSEGTGKGACFTVSLPLADDG